jgi:hypothetical protein
MFEDDLDLAKRCRHCFEKMIKINDIWVRKIYCQRCPVCGHKLPGILTVDAMEICQNRRCNYSRRVFTLEERQQLGWEILPEELEPSPPQLPDEYEYIQQQLILGRWWGEVNCRVYPLQDKASECFRSGLFDKGTQLEEEVKVLEQELMNQRARAEEILSWLRTDTTLRKMTGSTWPDAIEK